VPKEIWLGPVLGTQRDRLLARCADYVARGETDRLLYIAASHPLLDLATQKILDGQNSRGVWGEFPFYLFRGFVRRILSEAFVSEPRAVATGSRENVGNSKKGLHDPVATARGSNRTLSPRVPIDREELPLRHSLISQIIKQLADARQLPAIQRLANRDGCVSTVASLMGELQRAGKTAEEFQAIVLSRSDELQSPKSKDQSPKTKGPSPKSQSDFDRDVALIYAKYSEALDRFGLTDDDADQLRALEILRGDVTQVASLRVNKTTQVNNLSYKASWLDDVDLLVLDGFFDFTPVQGEMLRLLIPRIANVIVNVNHDARNEQIFQPFQSTIEQLKSIAKFEIKQSETAAAAGSALHSKLFNADEERGTSPIVRERASDRQDAGEPQARMPAIQLRECSDRETELRWIAKEIKRLICADDYKLSDIALVVRERSAYVDTILRVFEAESVPCNLERRVPANEIPAVRASSKLFQVLKSPEFEHVKDPKASEIAHLVKTGYFRVSGDDLKNLTATFDKQYTKLLEVEPGSDRDVRLRARLGIGVWAPDVIENVIAYIGSEQRVRAWLDRAARLIRVLPSSDAARSFIGADIESNDAPLLLELEPPAEDEVAPREKTKRPAPVHPAAIAWTMLLMEQMRQTIAAVPEEGTPNELRAALMALLDNFQFAKQVTAALTRRERAKDVPQVMLNVRGMEALRRALAATVRSFDFAQQIVSEARPPGRARSVRQPSLAVGLLTRSTLASFIGELERCLKSQVLSITAGDRDGVRVLEATDVRGLQFRAMFIAGMNEGSFPLRTSRDWLYPHEERERLKKHGVILEDISTETLVKEEHYFYQCACRATERLYLTRPLAADDGIETVASYYIEELRRAIAPAKIDADQVRSDISRQPILHASNPSELATKLIAQQARQGHRRRGENILPATVLSELIARARHDTYISDSVLRRVAIELQRGGDTFGAYDGQITQPDLRALVANHFGPEYVYSASGLSAFGNCPFKFFAARVMRLEPRNEAALDLPAIDAGKLLHDILRRFFERHRKDYLPDRNRDDLLKELAGVADEVFAEHERKVPPLNERIWKIDCEIRKLILEQVLLHELRLQEKTQPRGMTPTFFELAFGRVSEGSDPASKTEYLKIFREGAGSRTTGAQPVAGERRQASSLSYSEVALIQGQIDRVDVSETCESVVAYDYKLSQGARIIDMEAGRQLQIPIYLAALEQLFLPSFELAGGGYYRLRGKGKRLNQGLYRKMLGDCTYVSSYTAMVDDVRWQYLRRDISKRVWQFIDAMRAGDFRVKPSEGKKTCKFCDYSAACRYDGYRISRKMN
jgi:ATP-dependent helicase/DNAse subunit B